MKGSVGRPGSLAPLNLRTAVGADYKSCATYSAVRHRKRKRALFFAALAEHQVANRERSKELRERFAARAIECLHSLDEDEPL